jgi:hypothetical protein
MADVPVVLEASEIPDIVYAQPKDTYLVIHYTSSLASCGFCMRNNDHFEGAIKRLGDHASFGSVITDPWQDFGHHEQLLPFHADQGYRLVGIPVVVVYQNGSVIWHSYGEQPEISDMLDMGLLQD